MCLAVTMARAATGATVRVVKAVTARLEDATNRAARDDMLTRILLFVFPTKMMTGTEVEKRMVVVYNISTTKEHNVKEKDLPSYSPSSLGNLVAIESLNAMSKCCKLQGARLMSFVSCHHG